MGQPLLGQLLQGTDQQLLEQLHPPQLASSQLGMAASHKQLTFLKKLKNVPAVILGTKRFKLKLKRLKI